MQTDLTGPTDASTFLMLPNEKLAEMISFRKLEEQLPNNVINTSIRSLPCAGVLYYRKNIKRRIFNSDELLKTNQQWIVLFSLLSSSIQPTATTGLASDLGLSSAIFYFVSISLFLYFLHIIHIKVHSTSCFSSPEKLINFLDFTCTNIHLVMMLLPKQLSYSFV